MMIVKIKQNRELCRCRSFYRYIFNDYLTKIVTFIFARFIVWFGLKQLRISLDVRSAEPDSTSNLMIIMIPAGLS